MTMTPHLERLIESSRENLTRLEGERKVLLDSITAISTRAMNARRSFTAEESREVDTARARVEELDGELVAARADVEDLLDHDRRSSAVARVPVLNVLASRGSSEHHPAEVERMRPAEARDAALRVLDDPVARRHLAPGQLDKVDRLLRSTDVDNVDSGYLAKRMLITESPAYRSGWAQVMCEPRPLLTPEEVYALRSLKELEQRAMSSSDSAGGYGVPVLIDPTIILTDQGSLNPIRRIARVETITTDAWKGVSSAGVTWSWDAEASAVSDDSPELAQPVVNVHEARGFIPFSIRIGMDYPSFAEEMARLLAEGYMELTAEAFATGLGDGSNQPFGVITALDANTNVEVVVTSDGVFQAADINKVWGALPDRAKANATWVMSHDVGNEVAGFGNGNNLSFVTVDLTGVVSTLRQRPIEFASHFPDFSGTTGAANILVVGDFRKGYLIAERAGMSVELVPHLFDVTDNRPTGQRGWFAWARVGADTVDDTALRLLQNQ